MAREQHGDDHHEREHHTMTGNINFLEVEGPICERDDCEFVAEYLISTVHVKVDSLSPVIRAPVKTYRVCDQHRDEAEAWARKDGDRYFTAESLDTAACSEP